MAELNWRRNFQICARGLLVLGLVWVMVDGAAEAAAQKHAVFSAPSSPPRVVVSIAPLHALAHAVMAGVGEPALLLPAGASAHDYSMRPEGARLLSHADLIVWVGGEYERFLAKPLRALGPNRVIELLSELKGMPNRESGAWSAAHGHSDHASGEGGRETDPHLWLDPDNAKRIAALLARELAKIDPENAPVYAQNVKVLISSIDAAVVEATRILRSVQKIPYVVFHDAYQYFEAHFDMNAVGSIVVDPERPPGARRLREVRKKIFESGAVCVFHEPQFKPKLVEAVIRGGAAKSAPLDPLGVDIPPGPDAYPQLLLRIAGQLRSCLAP